MAEFGEHSLCHEAHVYIQILQPKYNEQQYNFEPAVITEVPHQNSLVCRGCNKEIEGLNSAFLESMDKKRAQRI